MSSQLPTEAPAAAIAADLLGWEGFQVTRQRLLGIYEDAQRSLS